MLHESLGYPEPVHFLLAMFAFFAHSDSPHTETLRLRCTHATATEPIAPKRKFNLVMKCKNQPFARVPRSSVLSPLPALNHATLNGRFGSEMIDVQASIA